MNNFQIDVRLGGWLSSSAARRLEKAAVQVLKRHGAAPGSELTIVLTDENEMQRLNREYRGIDKPTDVLSFGMDDRLPGDHDYLGDVVIAVPLAEAQAQAAGHDLLSELSLLSVHGVLHLLGHDHASDVERDAMWRMQDEILAQLGITARRTEV